MQHKTITRVLKRIIYFKKNILRYQKRKKCPFPAYSTLTTQLDEHQNWGWRLIKKKEIDTCVYVHTLQQKKNPQLIDQISYQSNHKIRNNTIRGGGRGSCGAYVLTIKSMKVIVKRAIYTH